MILFLCLLQTVTIKSSLAIRTQLNVYSEQYSIPTAARNVARWDSLGGTPRDYDLFWDQIDSALALYPANYLAQSYIAIDTAASDLNYNSGKTSGTQYLKYFRIASDTTKPVLFFTGSIHAGHEWQHGYCWRDLIGVINNNISDAFFKKLFADYQILVFPNVNTYGVFTSANYGNYNWVNLMQNFGAEWDAASNATGDRWSNPGESNYKGQKAFSEPETRAIKLVAEVLGGLHGIDLYYESHSAGGSTHIVYDRPYTDFAYWTADWDTKLSALGDSVVYHVGLLYPDSTSYPPDGYDEGVRGTLSSDVFPISDEYWNTYSDITSAKWFNQEFECPSFLCEVGGGLMATPESVYNNFNELYEELFFESILQTISIFLLNSDE